MPPRGRRSAKVTAAKAAVPAKSTATVRKVVKAAKAAPPVRLRPAMTNAHKAALAVGREQSTAVRRYLEALATSRPGRGRRTSNETLGKQLAAVDSKLETADPLRRLQLAQQKKDIESRLGRPDTSSDIAALEEAFLAVAAGYSASKGIDYITWREAGVPADVLKRAGVARTRS
jgi:hypothetical protein